MKSTRNYLIILLLLTTGAGLALAYREYLDLMALRFKIEDHTAGLQHKYDDAMALIKNLRAQLDAAHRSALAVRNRSAEGGPDAPGGDAGGPGNNRQMRREAMMAMFNSPQFQALRAVQEKAMLDQRYASLFRSLAQSGISAQQIDQLKNQLVQRQQATMDAAQAARQNGINPRTDAADFQQAINQATGDVDSQIKATLGDAAYAQYQQYQQTLPEQSVVSNLQQSLSYTSAPLSDAQAQQLVQVLQQSAPAGQTATPAFFGGGPGGPGGFGGFGGGNTVAITQQALTQASAFLSPSQVQALQQVQQQQQAQQQLQQLMRATFQQQGNPGGGTGGRGGGG
jgi:hypothetical protein